MTRTKRLQNALAAAIEVLESRRMLAAVTAATADLRGFSQGLSYEFDTSLTDAQVMSALSLLDLARESTVSRSNLAVTTTGANAKRVTWPGLAAGGTLSGVLEDGHYEAIIEDGSTSPFNSPSVLPFNFYRGDADGDTDVDFDDLLTLAQNYGGPNTPYTYSQGDFNYNGTVDFDDLLILAQKYNTKLPAMPAGSNSLTSGANTSSSVTLNFSPPIDAATGVASVLFTGFRVFRSINGVDFSQVSVDSDPNLQANGGAVYTYTDTGLSSGTKYWYRVRPYNTNGSNGAPTGNWHTTNKIWTVTGLPAPVNAQAEQISQNQLKLTWAAGQTVSSPNLVEYKVYRSSSQSYNGTEVATISPGQPFEYIATLPTTSEAEFYYVAARRVDTGAQSFFSSIVTTPPLPPLNVSAAVNESPLSIQLDWDDSTRPNTEYNVYRSTSPEFIPDPLVNLLAGGISASNYADTTVAADTRYYYLVTASNASSGNIQALQTTSESSASEEVTQTTSSAAPTGVTIEVVDDNDVQITWQDNSFLEVGFDIERETTPGVWEKIGEVGGDQTHFFASGLQGETTYNFRVAADFLIGPNRNSVGVQATTKAVGEATQLVLVILGHQQRMNNLNFAQPGGFPGATEIAVRLRNDGQFGQFPRQNNQPEYRVRRSSEFVFDEPDINWDGTGALLDWALSELQANQGIINVAVIGYSHGAAIARRVADRLDDARGPFDIWGVRYTAFIDAIERGPIDNWLPAFPERRIPQIGGGGQYRHDSFYSSVPWNPFTNPVNGDASNGGNNTAVALTHGQIDNATSVINSIRNNTRTALGF